MEIIGNNTPEPRRRPVTEIKNIYLGLAFLAAGIIWLGYNLDMVSQYTFNIIFSWEMLLMVVGGYLIASRKWLLGAILFALGAMFGLGVWFGLQLPVWDLMLPMVIIAIGISFLLRSLTGMK